MQDARVFFEKSTEDIQRKYLDPGSSSAAPVLSPQALVQTANAQHELAAHAQHQQQPQHSQQQHQQHQRRGAQTLPLGGDGVAQCSSCRLGGSGGPCGVCFARSLSRPLQSMPIGEDANGAAVAEDMSWRPPHLTPVLGIQTHKAWTLPFQQQQQSQQGHQQRYQPANASVASAPAVWTVHAGSDSSIGPVCSTTISKQVRGYERGKIPLAPMRAPFFPA